MFIRDLIVFLTYLFATSFLSGRAMVNHALSVQKAELEDINPSAVGLQFAIMVNNTGKRKRFVELVPDLCCMDVDRKMDCAIMKIVGRCVDEVPAGSSKSLKLVAPLIDPFNRKGYCNVFVDSKTADGKKLAREIVKIPFDTRLKSIYNKVKKKPAGVQICTELDQDPLNQCQPVNCQRYYNGRKSHFNKIVKKCVAVPLCMTEATAEMPRNIYNPVNNQCVDDKTISDEDLNYIKTLMCVQRRPKDILIVESSNKLGNATKMPFKYQTTKSIMDVGYKNFLIDCWMNNRRAYMFLMGLILLQTTIIFIMTYFYAHKCCCTKKKLVRKFYNYRQDATITTPLIGTSNLETDTTDYQYYSESSTNIDNRIKMHKACHKEIGNAKVSLSDDILLKCLKRRDWRTGSKSEAIHDYTTKVSIKKKNLKETPHQIKKQYEPKERDDASMAMPSTRENGVFVNFENESLKETKRPILKPRTNTTKKTSDHKSNNKKKPRTNDSDLSSEQEIVCHDYNNYKTKQPKTTHRARRAHGGSEIIYSEQEINCHSYNWDMDEGSMPTQYHRNQFCASPYSVSPVSLYAAQPFSAVSTDKSAKGYAKDSIDNILTERAMLLLAGEDMSKYSFSSDSKNATISSISGKTSKNNIMRNVLSILHRKPKKCPSSDPGATKSKDSLDLKVLHVSPVSNYSSTTGFIKGFRRGAKDSRSSS